LRNELTLHWHALSEAEKVEVLDALASPDHSAALDQRPSGAEPHVMPPVQHWLAENFLVMRPDLRNTLNNAVAGPTKAALAHVLEPSASVRQSLDPAPMHSNVAVENLFNYASFMKLNPVIGTVPEHAKDKTIAIVGAGPAGLVAAYELMKAGAKVQVFEASDRIGGRMDARSLSTNADGTPSKALAEMGAMRFPPSMEIYTHYADQFGVQRNNEFPNPGAVPSIVFFKGDKIRLEPGKPIEHPLLARMSKEWHQMEQSIVEPMMVARRANDAGKIRELWQGCIDRFQGLTLKQGVQQLAKENGFKWGPEEIDAFGAVGVGTGGYRPFFQVGFTDALRVMLNNLETDQQWLPDGTTAAMHKFASTEVERADGSKASLHGLGAIKLNTEITNVASHEGKPTLEMKNADGSRSKQSFDSVIFTGSPRNAEFANIAHSADATSDRMVTQEVAKALQETHMANASKLFIEVAKPFWETLPDKTQVILTDQPGQMTYGLKYPDSERAVVLVSYAWEQQADKLQGRTDAETLEILKTQIAKVHPEYAAHLVPAEGSKIGKVVWQDTKVHGAFALQMPDQMKMTNDGWKQFQSAKDDDPQPDSGVYLANDAYHHGGWLGPAFRGGLNSACAALKHIGGELTPHGPLEQDTNLYRY
jgi:tryptophan 2-monooxygenase